MTQFQFDQRDTRGDSRGHEHGRADAGGWCDDDLFAPIASCDLGVVAPDIGFIRLVDAIIAHPDQSFIAAGRNGASDATSTLFWTYTDDHTLRVEATAGFLSGAPGNGGFDLIMRADGSWSLSFDGSSTVIGHRAGEPAPAAPPPAAGLNVVDLPGTGASEYNASTSPPTLINGGLGYDTVQGGVGDYMIGGSGTGGGGLGGDGNCALYTSSPGSVLVDMEDGNGYGGNAQGDVYVNMNQTRGSLFSNVLIGSTSGTDLKSGGNDSLLISTGGDGFELRPDGSGNVLVSTVGADRVLFDITHGWQLGDDNIMLGFDPSHGVSLDLTQLMSGNPIPVLDGSPVESNFFTTAAAGYNPATGTGDIDDYVRIVDEADGSHVLFDPTGHVQSQGIELVDLEMTHGLNVDTLYANHQILV